MRLLIFAIYSGLVKVVVRLPSIGHALFSSEQGAADRLIPRWIVLRALGLIYCSAFVSLLFQIRGLIGPQGILPDNEYLQAVAQTLGHSRGLWYAPTLLDANGNTVHTQTETKDKP